MWGTAPTMIEGVPQFGRLEMLVCIISNSWEWPFKRRLSSLSVTQMEKGPCDTFEEKPVEDFTVDGKQKGCLRADSNTRLEKPSFRGKLFTKMAANNSSYHWAHIPLLLSRGEVYDPSP